MKTYIQIGANIGDDDFQRDVESLTEPSRIVLIEPNSKLINELNNNYQKIKNTHEVIILNKAISLQNEAVKLYIYNESEHSSLVKRRSHIPPIEEMEVESIQFNKLCDNLNIKNIHLLQIDTEGLDYEIVNSIDFSKIIIKKLIFEDWSHQDDDLNDKYRTGAKFLETEVRHKLEKMYDWHSIWLSHMPNHMLTLKNS